MTDQQQLDLRKDEVQAGTTTGLASPSVDVTKERQNSLWSDAWRDLRGIAISSLLRRNRGGRTR